MLIRPHRGSLVDAMAEVKEIEPTLEAVKKWASELYPEFPLEKEQVERIEVKPYSFDKRIDWDTYIVTIVGYGVVGFTNGPLCGEINGN